VRLCKPATSSSGTPEGVAWASGRFLKQGDLVEASLESIGTLSNKVVAGH
jgi:2-keto-4-pentenoate hydratase/2-oxohepta-3-ene-1,7-dioic acid hydratase in catechol pathway